MPDPGRVEALEGEGHVFGPVRAADLVEPVAPARSGGVEASPPSLPREIDRARHGDLVADAVGRAGPGLAFAGEVLQELHEELGPSGFQGGSQPALFNRELRLEALELAEVARAADEEEERGRALGALGSADLGQGQGPLGVAVSRSEVAPAVGLDGCQDGPRRPSRLGGLSSVEDIEEPLVGAEALLAEGVLLVRDAELEEALAGSLELSCAGDGSYVEGVAAEVSVLPGEIVLAEGLGVRGSPQGHGHGERDQD